MKPTESQQKAISGKGNILVSAAAGSGKTAVLVERVLNKISPADTDEQPVMANRLLIVTYTDAAAAEMRSRIEKRLFEEVKEHPEKTYLTRQIRLLQSADIGTIDSFCIRTLRDNFSHLGISPDFSVCSGAEFSLQKKSILNSILKPHFEAAEDEFLFLLELLNCEFDEENLCNNIESLFEKAMLSPSPEAYLYNLIKPYTLPFNKEHVWYKGFTKAILVEVYDLIDISVSMEKYAQNVGKNGDKYVKTTDEIIKIVSNLAQSVQNAEYGELKNIFAGAVLPGMPRSEKEDMNAAKVKELKKSISDKIKEIASSIEDENLVNENIKRIYPSAKLFCDLCREFAQKYYEMCLEENTFTFAFCEQMMLRLLCKTENGRFVNTEFAEELISKYDEVMVDEYQDVNDLQDMIFNIISSNGEHIFTVGDIKQSIYGFRGSNPENFNKRKKKCEDGVAEKIVLSDNFRSRKGVCRAVNHIFSNILSGQFGSIVYDKDEQLNSAADFPETTAPEAELLLVDYKNSDDERLEAEGNAIADYIKKTMAEGRILRADDNTMREARFDDFAVLLRSATENINIIADALVKNGIPIDYTAETYMETYEINLALSLLKVIDNPKSDLELLVVMMSPLFCFSADDMAEMRSYSAKESLYSSLIRSAKSGKEKAAKFAEFLSDQRKKFAVMPLPDAINELYLETDLLNLISVMPGGNAKRGNLLKLCRIAEKYTATSMGSIYGFLRYIGSLPDKSFKSEQTSKGGVKLMTMHSSKGLQFPICILSNLSKLNNNSDAVGSVLYSNRYGLSFRYFDELSMDVKKALNYRLCSKEAEYSMIDEEIRILYVAATRAEERLCFVCSCGNIQNKLSKLVSSLSEASPYIPAVNIKKGRSQTDWILSAALLDKGAEEIKKKFGLHAPEVNDEPTIKISIVTANNHEKNNEVAAEPSHEVDKELRDGIIENFAYTYPYEMLRGIEAKVSVSYEANGDEIERFAFTSKPSFMLENGLSAAGRGTAMHHVMQYISFDGDTFVESEIERLIEWRFITRAEADAVDVNAINRFFESDIFYRIKRSCDVRREMRFLTEMDISVLRDNTDGLPSDTKVLVQGAVDLCFVEDDGIVVLDFKTDKVKELSVLKERYNDQLNIYGRACEKIFGKPLKEKIIYSFELSDHISV